jgi:regulator of RNase E activity RraB
MKKIIVFCCGLLLICRANAQYREDWDTYINEFENNLLSSVAVDLAFANSAEAKLRTNVIIVRIRVDSIRNNGMPAENQLKKLNMAEDELAAMFTDKFQAIYTGRFTKDGKRDFYFYSNDTLNYRIAIAQTLNPMGISWMAKAQADTGFSNYFNVLYPTDKQLESIKNRRAVDNLKEKGDVLTAPRKINHFIFFKTEKDRKDYAFTVQDNGFTVENAGKEMGVIARPYTLEISRIDKVDYNSIDKVTLYLWELALKYSAKYDGWETFVVKANGEE